MAHPRSRGLSLIELLITVAIMSIAAALVIPSMDSTGVLRVQAAARLVVADIALAQTEAMAFQVRRAIYFGAIPDGNGGFVEGNGYVVCEPTTVPITIANVANYVIAMPDGSGEPFVRVFDNEVRFGGTVIDTPGFDGVPVLMFDELGSPLQLVDSGGGGPIEALAGNGGAVSLAAPGLETSYRVTVAAMTGRTDVIRVDN